MSETERQDQDGVDGRRGGFDYVRRREHSAPESRRRDVDSAQRAMLIRLLGQSSYAMVAGFLIGLVLDVKNPGPVPYTIVFGVGFGMAAAAGGYFLMEGGGKAASTLHNPSGRSTPFKREHSAAQALLMRGDTEAAIGAYERVLEEAPDDPRPLVAIARIYRDELENPEEAAAWFRRARVHPQIDSGRRFLATRELCELYTHQLNEPRKTLPLLAQVAETRAGTPEGDWAARELREVKAMVFGGDEA